MADEKKRQTLVRESASIKRKITHSFDCLERCENPDEIQNCCLIVNEHIAQIKALDQKVILFYTSVIEDIDCSGGIPLDEKEYLPQEYVEELDHQTLYMMTTTNRLKSFSNKAISSSSDVPKTLQGASDCKVKLPDLKCDNFSGEGATNLQYHNFISQFNNIVGNRVNLAKSTKLTYLLSYLKGYAYKIVQHLQITDDNYDVAIELLRNEFLNKPALIDELFKKLLEMKPKYDVTYLETKLYISEIRCILSDLKNYDINLVTDESAKIFLSHIVFSKLPPPFRQELVRKLNENFPNIEDIFDNYVDVVKTLNMKSVRYDAPNVNKTFQPRKKPYNESDHGQKKYSNFDHGSTKTYSTTNSNADQYKRNCKFCNSSAHNMSRCTKYPTTEARVARCRELELCTHCTG